MRAGGLSDGLRLAMYIPNPFYLIASAHLRVACVHVLLYVIDIDIAIHHLFYFMGSLLIFASYLFSFCLFPSVFYLLSFFRFCLIF